MGLSDILAGMQNGPRGQSKPSSGSTSGGLSPMTMALLGVLAYKALKAFGGGAQPASPGAGGRPASPPGGGTMAGNAAGGLGDILGGLFGGKPSGSPAAGKPGASLNDMIPGGLGGLLGGGAAAGSVLSGGLDKLIKDLQASGQGKVAQSWVGTGPNQEIEPDDLATALGSDTLDTLTKQTGMGREDLLAGLSQNLPDLVDQLTPHGRLPTAEEASRMV